ncbi:hypothetical protein N9Y92_00150 [Chlamydiales bacterium]|nr:hypothetical protein [Chlamydiales bacterium]
MNQVHLLSSYPAKWIDEILLKSPKIRKETLYSDMGYHVLSFLIHLGVLFPALLIDTLHYGVKSLSEHTWSLISTKNTPESTMEKNAQTTDEVALKCLRGLATFPAGVIWDDVVSNHFLREPENNQTIKTTGRLYHSQVKPKFSKTIEEFSCL